MPTTAPADFFHGVFHVSLLLICYPYKRAATPHRDAHRLSYKMIADPQRKSAVSTASVSGCLGVLDGNALRVCAQAEHGENAVPPLR